MFTATKAEIPAKVEGMGDFSKLKIVAKKAKRIGLLSTSADTVVILHPGRCQDIDDITNNGYTFTDGCGLISSHLAGQLVSKRKIVY